jgi:uncharacterized protein YjbI with pentapeptide repeats
LKTLNLSANHLTGSLPVDLHSLSALETLDLSQNSLSNAVSLGVMPQLTTLDLRGNSFSGGLTSLGIFPQLQYLDLSDNDLSGTIPVSSGWFLALCETTLRHLDLHNNDLDGTLPDLGEYTRLEELDLSDNQLTGSIPGDFNNLTLLQTLDLSGNHLTNGVPNLGGLVQLQELNLSGNHLSGSIPVSLLALHQLQTLNLSSNHFTGTLFEFSLPLQSLEIQLNDLDFTSVTPGVENNNDVQAMRTEGIGVTWLPQNGPSVTQPPQPKSDPSGGSDPFSVTVEGAPPLSFQWQLNGTNLFDNGRINGSQTASLSFNSVQSSDAGSYQIVITNAYGSITSAPAMLTVTTVGVAPVITSQPINQSVGVGQSASFSVTATGSTPLLYQWFLNGTNLAGATMTTMALTRATLSNAGAYSVTVSNSFGGMSNWVGNLIVTNVPLSLGTNGAGLQYANGLVILQVNGLTGIGTAIVEVSSNLTQWTPFYTNATTIGTVQVIANCAKSFVTREGVERAAKAYVAPEVGLPWQNG